MSWRLASELVRRHPDDLLLDRAHPGGGQYDCLVVHSAHLPGTVMLNREGTIQVHGRFDGGASNWPSATWDQYMQADSRIFLQALEDACGLQIPISLPASSPPVLLYRVFATLSALRSKTPKPYRFEQGFVDTSGHGAGPNEAIKDFPNAARELQTARASDTRAEPGFRYWMVWQAERPLWAFERDRGSIWTSQSREPHQLMQLYARSGRQLEATVLSLFGLLGKQ